MKIHVVSSGGTPHLDGFLARIIHGDIYARLEPFAQRGVDALKQHTPVESGLTRDSWFYEIKRGIGHTTIYWKNIHTVNGFNVAIGLQYGHATGTGGWVQGYDYINPALKPIFDEIANAVWNEVQQA